MSTQVSEVLISELQCRILVEVYLAHGPVDIFRLWSEMFERQQSISSGLLSFTRAIVRLEDEGYLQKVAEMNSTLAPKGEMYLIGAVLSGELPEGCWEKLSSTQNILDVSPQGGTGVSGGVDGHARGALGHRSEVHKCACRDTRVSPSTEGLSRSPVSTRASPTDSQFQGTTIEALVDAVFRAEERAEQARLEEIEAEREGGDTAASGYPEPGSHPSFA